MADNSQISEFSSKALKEFRVVGGFSQNNVIPVNIPDAKAASLYVLFRFTPQVQKIRYGHLAIPIHV
jgi:hypothetical protein